MKACFGSWRHTTACAGLVIASGCEPGSAGIRVEGPTVVLDAQSPVASFEVTLCMDAPALKSITPSGRIHGEWVASEGAELVVLAENLDIQPDDPFDGGAAAEDDFAVELEVDPRGWDDRTGRKCVPTQTIQFEAPELAEGESATVTWQVRFGANFHDRIVRNRRLEEAHLIVEIEPM